MANKSPKLFLRQSCVIDSTKHWKPGTFLEVGAGIGLMTQMFLSRGFSGCCYDLSPESRDILRTRLNQFGDQIKILSELPSQPNTLFDYLLAFEVLEHIEDDLHALQQWSKFIKTDGKVIISVPAHKNKFSRTDELVGHVRRYEKNELLKLLTIAGYKNIKIINYGYPITEISRYLSNIILNKETSFQASSVEERSLKSSYSRPAIINNYLSKTPENIFSPFKYIQRLFYKFDFGDGLVAVADKI